MQPTILHHSSTYMLSPNCKTTLTRRHHDHGFAFQAKGHGKKCRGKFGVHDIFVKPDLKLKPSSVVIIFF